MGDFGFAVAAVRLVISSAHGQDEVPRMALALSDQEAAVLPLLGQQLLGLPARQVSVEPSAKNNKTNKNKQTNTYTTVKMGFNRKTEVTTENLMSASTCDWDKLVPFFSSMASLSFT